MDPAESVQRLSNQRLNAILDDLAVGKNGKRYSAAPNANDRAARKVVVKHAPDKPERQARQIIKTWLKSGLVVEEDFYDSERRENVKGLHVDNAKRPGTAP